MADLSTPLLDAVINKLIDPSLDCKTLAYDPNAITSTDSSTVGLSPTTSTPSETLASDPNTINESPESPTAGPSLTVPTPNAQLSCPPDATGTMQYNGCTGKYLHLRSLLRYRSIARFIFVLTLVSLLFRQGYYHCVYGGVTGGVISCPSGTSFDETSMLCLRSEDVISCSGTQSPQPPSSFPTKVPSLSPQETPIRHPFQSPQSPSSFPPAVPLLITQETPTDHPTFGAYFLLDDDEPNSSPPSIRSSNPKESPSSSKKPQTWSSWSSSKAPTKTPTLLSIYTTAADIYCPDEFTGVLPWNECSEYFYCLLSVPQLPTIPCEVGKLFDIESRACLDESQVTCLPRSEQQTSPSLASLEQVSIVQEPPTSTTSFESSIGSSGSNLPQISLNLQTNQQTNLTSTSSFDSSLSIENSGNNFPQTSLDPQIAAPSPELPSMALQKDDVTTSETLLSTLPLVGPFITILLSFNDSPIDIGWQLLSQDETINVARQTGAYSSMKTNTTVYETVSLQTSLALSTDIRVQWTIVNVRGKGLAGGSWKIYTASPVEANLLAEGGNFKYTETVWLTVTNEGFISVLDENGFEDPKTNATTTLFPNVAALQLNEPSNSGDQSNAQTNHSLIVGIVLLVVGVLFAAFLLLALSKRMNESESFEDPNFFGDTTEDWDLDEECYNPEHDQREHDNYMDDLERSIGELSANDPGDECYNPEQDNCEHGMFMYDLKRDVGELPANASEEDCFSPENDHDIHVGDSDSIDSRVSFKGCVA